MELVVQKIKISDSHSAREDFLLEHWQRVPKDAATFANLAIDRFTELLINALATRSNHKEIRLG